MPMTVATKGNLMAARRSMALARNGWELMDRKRSILVRELMERVERAAALQRRIDTVFQTAYQALAIAEIVSPGGCGGAAAGVTEDGSVRLRWRSVMGVELPSVTAAAPVTDAMPYAPAAANSSLDEAFCRFSEVKALLAELAETEVSVYRLAYAIKKSQKRANALERVVIPRLEADIDRIGQALAEKEREEFVRQKVVKARASAARQPRSGGAYTV